MERRRGLGGVVVVGSGVSSLRESDEGVFFKGGKGGWVNSPV